MNIFVTDKNASIAATCLDDVRLRKMIIESAQILCTVVSQLPTYMYDYEKSPLYKPTHKNHPSVKWAIESNENWSWLFSYWRFLHDEYVFRFNKHHLTFTKLFDELLRIRFGVYFAIKDPIGFIYVGTEQSGDVFEKYRNLLNEKWKSDIEKNRSPKWTKREKPEWAIV